MKPFTFCVILALWTGSSAAAESAVPTIQTITAPLSPQEERWREILALFKKYPEADPKAEMKRYMLEKDVIYRTLRLKGLAFWDAYPDDERRFRWFVAMENRGFIPNYIDTHVEFDPDELRLWRARQPGLRAEFLASPKVTPDQRVQLRYDELRFDVLKVSGRCRWGFDLDPDRAAKLTPESVVNDILDYANTHPPAEQCTEPRVKVGRYPVDLMNLLMSTHLRGETPESRRIRNGFIPLMLASKLPAMRQYASDSMATWSTEPLIVMGRTLTGEDFNLETYRGKLVLLDCWATWCAPCIEDLPALRKVSERYGPQGLAVVGVSLDPAANRDKVMAVLNKAGATWPQIAEAQELSRRLGCRAVPHVLLIGRDGRVIASGSLRLREIEALISEHLQATH